jgi:large subunit ribosomal protein L25
VKPKGENFMEEQILKAMARAEALNKVRNAGFIPGVLNEAGKPSTSVQFETAALDKVIAKHGPNAKVWVELAAKKHFGFIKEVQRHPLERRVIHVAIQLVSKDKELKMHLPITFHGREDLEGRSLEVHIHKSEIEVSGRASLMPDFVVADISKKEKGENVTVLDFHLPKEIKTLDSENEIYAIIKAIKEDVVEAPEELTPTE